ncbi:MAG: hypothetical protein VX589_10200, partial [Myxococcota bacterium]|nr:hypothetical protein [Myxococcota bacterium]
MRDEFQSTDMGGMMKFSAIFLLLGLTALIAGCDDDEVEASAGGGGMEVRMVQPECSVAVPCLNPMEVCSFGTCVAPQCGPMMPCPDPTQVCIAQMCQTPMPCDPLSGMCPEGLGCINGLCVPSNLPQDQPQVPMGGTAIAGPMGGMAAVDCVANPSACAPMAGMAAMMSGGAVSATGGTMVNMGGQATMMGGGQPMNSMEAGCVRDFDCAVGQSCEMGQCVADPDAPQDNMMMAQGGVMMMMNMGGVPAGVGTVCMRNAECPGDLFCVNGACATCRLDSDCGPNQRCNDSGACIDVPPECENDNDCRADGSQICQGGRCIEAQCFGHQQCRVGSRCVAGACQLGPPGDGGGT